MSSPPRTMWAMKAREPGPPSVLERVELDTPVPRGRRLLIEVHAAGMSRADLRQREGLYPAPPGESYILGLEVSGVVAAVGDAVTRWKVGDTVCALVGSGAYAQYCLADEDLVLPVPRELTLLQAAAVPESAFTVWANVFDACKLRPGEDLLVHGGASSIGTTAIQLATAMGSRVFITAGTDEKCETCRQLGAVEAINYKTQDFVQEIKRATNGRGVDVILDMVGGDYFNRNIEVAAIEGRIVWISFLNGSTAEVNFSPVLRKRLVLTASAMRGRALANKAAVARHVEQSLWPHWDSGQLKPWIHTVFPMQEAAAAHTLMESSTHTGKILLRAA